MSEEVVVDTPVDTVQEDNTDVSDSVDTDVDTSDVADVDEAPQKPDYEGALAAERRRADDAEARVRATQEVYTQQFSQQDRARQEQAERERIMAMTPEERMMYAGEQQERRLQQITQQAEYRIQDANDRAEYAVMAASNEMAKKYQSEVEKRIGEARSQGINLSRKVALTYLIGEKTLDASTRGASRKQKREAAENTKRSTTSATSGVGDQRASGRSDSDSREARNERLRNRETAYR